MRLDCFCSDFRETRNFVNQKYNIKSGIYLFSLFFFKIHYNKVHWFVPNLSNLHKYHDHFFFRKCAISHGQMPKFEMFSDYFLTILKIKLTIISCSCFCKKKNNTIVKMEANRQRDLPILS